MNAFEKQEKISQLSQQEKQDQDVSNSIINNAVIESENLIDQVRQNIEKINKVDTIQLGTTVFTHKQSTYLKDIRRDINLNFNIINLLIAHIKKIKILCIEDYINLMLNPYKYTFNNKCRIVKRNEKKFNDKKLKTMKSISNNLLITILLSLKSIEYKENVQYNDKGDEGDEKFNLVNNDSNQDISSYSQEATNFTQLLNTNDSDTITDILISQSNYSSEFDQNMGVVHNKPNSNIYNTLIFSINNIQSSIRDLNKNITNRLKENALEEIIVLGFSLLFNTIKKQIEEISEEFNNNSNNFTSEEIKNITLLIKNTNYQSRVLSVRIDSLTQNENFKYQY